MSNALERHTLVWLTAAGWDAAIADAQPEHVAGLAQWRHHDWPAIVRRTDPRPASNGGSVASADGTVAENGDTAAGANGTVAGNGDTAARTGGSVAGDGGAGRGDVCLGVPLPPDADGVKVRIPLRASAGHIARTSAPLDLRAALPAAGPWREGLAKLAGAAPSLRVFGSLAMQSLTGLHYVSPASDIDLLFHPASAGQLDEVIALLAHHAAELPLDGEIVFPGGAAVSWKEWLMATRHPAKVMVKELGAVRLADTASLLATLEAS